MRPMHAAIAPFAVGKMDDTHLYVVGAEPPQGLAGDHAEQQVVLVDAAAELELLKLARAERHAGPAVPVELGQQVGDDVLLVVALDHHAVDAGPERAQVRGQRDPGRHELVQRHLAQAVHHRFRVVSGRAAVSRGAVHLFGQVQRVRHRVLDQCPAAQRRARQQYRPPEQSCENGDSIRYDYNDNIVIQRVHRVIGKMGSK